MSDDGIDPGSLWIDARGGEKALRRSLIRLGPRFRHPNPAVLGPRFEERVQYDVLAGHEAGASESMSLRVLRSDYVPVARDRLLTAAEQAALVLSMLQTLSDDVAALTGLRPWAQGPGPEHAERLVRSVKEAYAGRPDA